METSCNFLFPFTVHFIFCATVIAGEPSISSLITVLFTTCPKKLKISLQHRLNKMKSRKRLVFQDISNACANRWKQCLNFVMPTSWRSEWFSLWSWARSGLNQGHFSPLNIFLKSALVRASSCVACARLQKSLLPLSGLTKLSRGASSQYSWLFLSQEHKLQRPFSLRQWGRITWPPHSPLLLEMSPLLAHRSLLSRCKCFLLFQRVWPPEESW